MGSETKATRLQPLVSTRISIAWPPSIPPNEPTHTLVLTGSKYFVDVRFYRDLKVATNEGVKNGLESRIQWALAGTKTFLEDSTKGEFFSSHPPVHSVNGRALIVTENPKARWDYLINSRQDQGDHGQADIGSMTTLPNGDILETGSMYNPDIGQVMKYEEVWRDLDIPSGSVVCFLESVDVDKELGWKAFVARVGPWQLQVEYHPTSGTCIAWQQELRGRLWEVILGSGRAGKKEMLPPLPTPLPIDWAEMAFATWVDREWHIRELYYAD